MRHAFFRTGLVIATVAPLFTFGIPAAFAQTSAGITIKPAIVEDNVKPGEIYQFTLTATNESGAPQTYYLVSQDIKGLDDQGHPVFATPGEQTGFELSSWITLPQSSVTLAPGASANVPVTVRVPANASPGAHFAGVFFEEQPGKLNTTGAAVGYNVGAVVSLTIAGNIVENAQLEEFSTNQFVYGSPDVTFLAKVSNSGNVLARPNGIIEVKNMFGKQVATINVNDSGGAVFPGSSRTFSAVWQGEGFAFGRYEALASLAYGEQGRKSLTSTTSFWILPLNIIAWALGGIIVAVLAIYILMRLWVRRKLRQMGVTGESRADASYYQKRYQQSGARLIITLLIIALACVVLLGALFLLFA